MSRTIVCRMVIELCKFGTSKLCQNVLQMEECMNVCYAKCTAVWWFTTSLSLMKIKQYLASIHLSLQSQLLNCTSWMKLRVSYWVSQPWCPDPTMIQPTRDDFQHKSRMLLLVQGRKHWDRMPRANGHGLCQSMIMKGILWVQTYFILSCHDFIGNARLLIWAWWTDFARNV